MGVLVHFLWEEVVLYYLEGDIFVFDLVLGDVRYSVQELLKYEFPFVEGELFLA